MPMDKPRGVVFIPTPNENHVNKSLRNVNQPSLTSNGSLRAHEFPAYFGVTTMDASHRLCTLTVLRTAKRALRHPRRAWVVEKREWGIYAAYRRLKKLGLTQMYGNTPSYVYQPDWADLLNIYETVRRRKPRIIIEFGSGCSTLMFARALVDNGSGYLYSIDASEPFLRRTQSYLPENLKPYVSLSYSEIEIGEMSGQNVMWHQSVPDVPADLVYLDGPDYQDFSADIETQADGILLESKASKDYTILIDGRWQTFEFTRDNLKGRYSETVDHTHFWECLSR
jgi:Methyltransferase domain